MKGLYILGRVLDNLNERYPIAFGITFVALAVTFLSVLYQFK